MSRTLSGVPLFCPGCFRLRKNPTELYLQWKHKKTFRRGREWFSLFPKLLASKNWLAGNRFFSLTFNWIFSMSGISRGIHTTPRGICSYSDVSPPSRRVAQLQEKPVTQHWCLLEQKQESNVKGAPHNCATVISTNVINLDNFFFKYIWFSKGNTKKKSQMKILSLKTYI